MINLKEKIDLIFLETEYGRDISDLFNKDFDSLKIREDFKIKENVYFHNHIKLKCDFCGNWFLRTFLKFFKHLRSKKNDREAILPEVISCPSTKCMKEKKALILKKQTILFGHPTKNCTYSEEQRKKFSETNRRRGTYDRLSKARKGKTVEEIFGEEKGKKFKEKIRKVNPVITKGFKPHLGCRHSEESKKSMTASREKFLEQQKIEKNYISPITGEKISFKQYSSEIRKVTWANKSEEEKERIRKASAERVAKKGFWKHSALCGDIEIDHQNEKIHYESSYERDFILKMKKNGKFIKRCDFVVPYIHPKDGEIHFFNPDFTIYKDASFSRIEKIVEIKPYIFAVNPLNRKGKYYRITKAKIEALENHAKENNYKYEIVTDKEIYGKPIKI